METRFENFVKNILENAGNIPEDKVNENIEEGTQNVMDSGKPVFEKDNQ
jgi:hypothetical protein